MVWQDIRFDGMENSDVVMGSESLERPTREYLDDHEQRFRKMSAWHQRLVNSHRDRIATCSRLAAITGVSALALWFLGEWFEVRIITLISYFGFAFAFHQFFIQSLVEEKTTQNAMMSESLNFINFQVLHVRYDIEQLEQHLKKLQE